MPGGQITLLTSAVLAFTKIFFLQARRSAEDRLVGSLFEEPSSASGTVTANGVGVARGEGVSSCDVNVSSADVGFVNMIRSLVTNSSTSLQFFFKSTTPYICIGV